jgi:putative intracellular protease/amidase
MALPRKVLLCVSSYNEKFYPDGAKTGLYYSEALHPYDEFAKAGFEIDLVSETGRCGLDEHSIAEGGLTPQDKKEFDDVTHPLNIKLKNIKKASQVNASEYGLFFAAGGHAALFDFPSAKALQSIAADVWNRGGVVSAVCHGPALLPGVIDKKTGKSIVAGRTVTGFSLEGELQFGVLDIMKQAGLITIEDAAKQAGGKYMSPARPLDDFVETADRLITGANPASARSTAIAVIKAFDGLTQSGKG